MKNLVVLSLVLLSAGGAAPAGAPDKEKVAELIKQLKGSDAAARGKAIEALGKLGPSAKEAVPALVDVIKKEKTFTLHPAGSKPPLRLLAIGALGRIGPDAREAVPVL